MQVHGSNITQEGPGPQPSPKRSRFQATKLLQPNLSPRVTFRCLKEPSTYEGIMGQLRQSNKRHYFRSIRHLKEKWRAERDAYELFYETVAALRGGNWSVNAFGLPTRYAEEKSKYRLRYFYYHRLVFFFQNAVCMVLDGDPSDL